MPGRRGQPARGAGLRTRRRGGRRGGVAPGGCGVAAGRAGIPGGPAGSRPSLALLALVGASRGPKDEVAHRCILTSL